jgi:hypothetical protein
MEGTFNTAGKRRKLEDATIAKLELENQQLAIANQKLAFDLYAQACPDGKPDKKARLLFRENLFGLLRPRTASRLERGPGSDSELVSVSEAGGEVDLVVEAEAATQAEDGSGQVVKGRRGVAEPSDYAVFGGGKGGRRNNNNKLI